MVHTRHCMHTRMQVYKVGRAKDAGRRLQQYPKGSRLLARLPVSHMLDSEKVLLTLCRANFLQRRDFGTEYFEGELGKVVAMLAVVVQMFPYVEQPITVDEITGSNSICSGRC